MKQIDNYTKSVGWAKRILPSWLAFSFCLMVALLQSSIAVGQTENFCSGNCTSGDIRITKVELLDINRNPLPANCDQGVPVQVRLKIYFNVTSQTRYGFLVTGDVYNNGSKTKQFADCSSLPYQQGPREFITNETFDWKCGDKLELRNVFTAWENSAPSNKTPSICSRLVSGQVTDCAAIRPKCYYYGAESKDAITVITPVQAGFEVAYGGCSDGNGNPIVYKPITFSGTGEGGMSPYSYQWVVRDSVAHTVLAVSSISSSKTTYTYTPTGPNNLAVKFIVTDSSTPQKKITSTKLITVQSCCTSPTVGTSPAAQIKCAGETARFTVVPSGGSPEPTIQWQVLAKNASEWGNVIGATEATLEITNLTTAMDGNKYRAVLRSGACAPATSADALLTVYAIPDAPLVGAQYFCAASNPTVASLPQGNGAYKWYLAQQGGASLGSNVSINLGTLWVSTTVNGCESPRSSVSITVYQIPSTASVGADQKHCGTLISASLGGNSPSIGAGAWSKKNGPGTVTFSSINLGNATATVSTAGTYVFTWTISSGTCTTSSADITVNYFTAQEAPSLSPTPPTCSNSNGTVTVTAPLDGNGIDYEYSSNGGSSWQETTTFTIAAGAGYSIIVRNKNTTCVSTATTGTMATQPQTPDAPTVCIVQPSLCGPAKGSVTIMSPRGTGFKYSINNGTTWSDSPIFTDLDAGSVTGIKVMSDKGCISPAADCSISSCASGLTSQSTNSIQSTEQPKADDQLTAYPIPFTQNVTLEYKAEQSGKYEINLYDMKGQLIRQLKSGTAKAGEVTQIEVDGRSMADGMYLARMVSASGAKTVKLLKKNK